MTAGAGPQNGGVGGQGDPTCSGECSPQLGKLVRKLRVLWGPVTKFASCGKFVQSLLTCFIVYEIVAL